MTNFNFQFSTCEVFLRKINFQLKKGFTLLEFLVVLGILSITVGSTLLFLTSVLRGSNQANVTAEVKQNGQIVLNSLEKQIRNAIDAEQVGDPALNTIKLIRQDDIPLYVTCLGFSPSQNGSIGTKASES